MKLTLIESSSGIHRHFSFGNDQMTVSYFIAKASELYGYDRFRVRFLHRAHVINKAPDQS